MANLELIARQGSIVALAALGMTCVIISGGIDLSVGSVVALVTVDITLGLKNGHSPLLSAFEGVLVLIDGSFETYLLHNVLSPGCTAAVFDWPPLQVV